MPFTRFLKQHSYTTQVILLIALLGAFRVMLGIANDVIRNLVKPEQLLLDVVFIAVFAAVFMLALRRKQITHVPLIYGIVFILLLGINFVQLGKTRGLSELNYYTGFIGIIMLYSGRRLYILLTLQVALVIFLIILDYMPSDPVSKIFFSQVTTGRVGFVFAILITIAFTVYLKRIIKGEVARYDSVNEDLRSKIQEIKNKNLELEMKQAELQFVQELLKTEIDNRSYELKKQNEAIENYLRYNTEELAKPLHRLHAEINRLDQSSPLHRMVLSASAELHRVAGSLQKAIEKGERIQRSKIFGR